MSVIEHNITHIFVPHIIYDSIHIDVGVYIVPFQVVIRVQIWGNENWVVVQIVRKWNNLSHDISGLSEDLIGLENGISGGGLLSLEDGLQVKLESAIRVVNKGEVVSHLHIIHSCVVSTVWSTRQRETCFVGDICQSHSSSVNPIDCS